MEEKRSDALEMATQAHEKRKAQKVEEVKLGKWYAVIVEPKSSFQKLGNFEQIVADYTILLLTVGIAAGTYYFLISMIRALYYQFLGASVNYVHLIQYTLGGSISIFFFFFFAGTFLLLFLSAILRPFYKIKYTQLLTIMIYALAPLLLFGWILPAVYALVIWSIILFVIGIKEFKKESRTRGSIRDRQ